mgnify:CR=1 FL=1
MVQSIAHSDPSERPALLRRFLGALGEALVCAGSSSEDRGTAAALDGFARLTHSIDPMSDWPRPRCLARASPRLSILGQRPGRGSAQCRGAAQLGSSGARPVAVVGAESQLPASASRPRVSRELRVRGHRRSRRWAAGACARPTAGGWRAPPRAGNSLPAARASGGRDLLPLDPRRGVVARRRTPGAASRRLPSSITLRAYVTPCELVSRRCSRSTSGAATSRLTPD